MPWLNWSLKLHIKLRTISLLISTHNTQVYVLWMSYPCVIVLVKICFHMLNLCWFKYKKIFECFKCFWKVFCFYKNWKISKTLLSCFSDLVAGHPSYEIQPRAHVLILAIFHEWKVQLRGVHRDFCGSAHDSLAGRPSSREKHLENFSQFCLWVFWRLELATHFSRENRMFGKN